MPGKRITSAIKGAGAGAVRQRIGAAAFLSVLFAAMTAVTGLSGNASASSATTTLTDVSTLNCLDSNTSGSVYALSCNGGNYQNWIQQPVGGGLNKGIVNLIDAQTGRCLDSNTSGNIYTLPCNGGNFQHWQRSTIVTFQIFDNYTAKCVGIDFCSGLAGSWTCTTNPDQTWHWGLTNAAGYTQLVNGNGACLGVDSGSLTLGANIRAWPCDGTASQYWRTLNSPASASGYYYLQNYNSGYVIGVGGASTANGASLVQWPQVSHPDQYWTGS